MKKYEVDVDFGGTALVIGWSYVLTEVLPWADNPRKRSVTLRTRDRKRATFLDNDTGEILYRRIM